MNFRRRVYYISGYDPRGPSHYHALYKQQCAEQCKINDMDISVGHRQRMNTTVSRWQIHASEQGQIVETDYQFLRWDDIIRRHWAANPWDLLKEMLFNLRVYMLSGLFGRLMKISWPVTVAGGLLPQLYVLLLLLLTVGIAVLTHSARTHYHLPMTVVCLSGFIAIVLLWWCGQKMEKTFQIFWVLRIAVFLARQAQGKVPELDTRIHEMRDWLLNADHSELDEVLIVGHSVGAMLAVSLLARVFEHNPAFAEGKTKLSLLTLGHCLPITAIHPEAIVFRKELLAVAENKKIKWLDFTAPSDGACCPLSDPVTAVGLTRSNPKHTQPKLLSPRYVHLFTKASYQDICRNKLRMHFQYLMATEIEGAYDYFAITAGNMTLPHRFTEFKSINNYTRPGLFK